jgi:RNA polymerase sigma-70 factor (ECF subfamily)
MKSHAENETSFEALFLKHYESVFGVLYRMLGDRTEADDMAQRVFLKLYHNMDRIGAQEGETNYAGWLYRVAVNEGYNALRSRQRRASWHERFGRLWSITNAPPDPARLAESEDTQVQVRRILAEMKPRDAKLLLLRHAGLSYKELADVLDIAPSSVGPMLTHAKRIFAKKYQVVFSETE